MVLVPRWLWQLGWTRSALVEISASLPVDKLYSTALRRNIHVNICLLNKFSHRSFDRPTWRLHFLRNICPVGFICRLLHHEACRATAYTVNWKYMQVEPLCKAGLYAVSSVLSPLCATPTQGPSYVWTAVSP